MKNHKFYFNQVKDAVEFYDKVRKIIDHYDIVTLADLYDLHGIGHDDLDEKIVWARDTVLSATHIYPDAFSEYYCVEFPKPDQYPASKRESYNIHYYNVTPRNTATKPKENSTPEPLNITILMDPTKDPYTTIREVIQQANEVKDRPVFITIS